MELLALLHSEAVGDGVAQDDEAGQRDGRGEVEVSRGCDLDARADGLTGPVAAGQEQAARDEEQARPPEAHGSTSGRIWTPASPGTGGRSRARRPLNPRTSMITASESPAAAM